MPSSPSWRRTLGGALPFALFVAVALLTNREWVGQGPTRVPYSELLTSIEGGQVLEVEIGPEQIVATLRAGSGQPPPALVAERVPGVEDPALLEALRQQGVKIRGRPERSSWWGPLLWALASLALLPLLFLGQAFDLGGERRGRPMTFGRSRPKLYDRSREAPATFADVAGVDGAKAELAEIVNFLKEPGRYREVGARVPKGVLLVGAPGTGKTLLARAVAGEASVPFFSISGSEFVEMFVGVGASRVRDLFEQAKERAPCIVFIDELDAVGKARSGAAGFASNEEREQTLNQLLVEMDGFDAGGGLVVMAASNRPEILDRALLRAGRFDRQVVVDGPDVRGREAILRVHARKVRLGADVDLELVARRTPGMVGADLANAVNEAALASVRRGGANVTACDFEEAIDRIQLGLKREGRVMNEAEKKRVAVHEAGHALIALSLEGADPVHRVTILPRSVGALGATLQLPTRERFLMTRAELGDHLCLLLGGRSAEELVCRDVSTGAQDDLERATELARQMVCRFGMSEALGPLSFEGTARSERGQAFPGAAGGREFSEETARLIDAEVKALIESQHERARRALAGRRRALDAVAGALLERETLDRAELEALVRAAPPAFGAAPEPLARAEAGRN